MSEIHMDFAFLGKEKEAGKTIPVVVAKERTSRMLMAAAVPIKTTGTYITSRIIGFLREIGCLYGDVIVKTDQEAAMQTLRLNQWLAYSLVHRAKLWEPVP